MTLSKNTTLALLAQQGHLLEPRFQHAKRPPEQFEIMHDILENECERTCSFLLFVRSKKSLIALLALLFFFAPFPLKTAATSKSSSKT